MHLILFSKNVIPPMDLERLFCISLRSPGKAYLCSYVIIASSKNNNNVGIFFFLSRSGLHLGFKMLKLHRLGSFKLS